MPGQTPLHPYIKYVGTGVALLLALGVYAALSYFAPKADPAPQQTMGESIRTGTAERPPITASSTIKELTKTKGFNALVSYTDDGFEPADVRIKKGQTVRFTNNSSNLLQLVIDGLEQMLPIQQYYEHTFTSAKDYEMAAQGSTQVGIVHVE